MWKDSRCIKIMGGKPPNYRWQCVHCDRQFTGGSRKFFNHIMGITSDKSAQIAPCLCAVIDPTVMAFCASKIDDSARTKRHRDEAGAEMRNMRSLREEEVRRDRDEEDASTRTTEGSSCEGSAKRQCGLPETLQRQCKLSVVKKFQLTMAYRRPPGEPHHRV